MIYNKSELLFTQDESYIADSLVDLVATTANYRQEQVMLKTGQAADLLILSPKLYVMLHKAFSSTRRYAVHVQNNSAQYLSVYGPCGQMMLHMDNRFKNILMATNKQIFDVWLETEAFTDQHKELISDNYLYKIVDQAFEDIVLGE